MRKLGLYTCILLFIPSIYSLIWAQQSASEAYRNGSVGRIQIGAPQEEAPPSAPDPEVTQNETGSDVTLPAGVRPRMRPEAPPVVIEEAKTEDTSILRRDVEFTNTTTSDRNTEFFKKFQIVFKKCSGGCDAGWAHIHRAHDPSKRIRNELGKLVDRITSCHHRNEAIDVHSLICSDGKYSAYTARFKRFVDCVEGESHEGKQWKKLFRQPKTGKCAKHGGGAETGCHHNHAHFSLGCWKQRRDGTWKIGF